jgi:hypothetical protein
LQLLISFLLGKVTHHQRPLLLNVPYIVVPTTTMRYWLTGNIAKKLTQAKNFSNSPSGTTFWAAGVAGDRFGRYVLARSVAGGSKKSRN